MHQLSTPGLLAIASTIFFCPLFVSSHLPLPFASTCVYGVLLMPPYLRSSLLPQPGGSILPVLVESGKGASLCMLANRVSFFASPSFGVCVIVCISCS
jgi:hypothetical protein